jgi:photosystem II stability/assembly factor-like uncharacterized protein
MRTLLCCLLVATAIAQQSWSVQKPDLATILIGVSFVSPAEGFLAGDANGVGPIVLKTTDGGNSYRPCNHSTYTAMFLSIAMGNATNGVVTGVGIGKNFHGIEYTEDGQFFNATTTLELIDTSQNVEAIKNVKGGFGITGEFNEANGVAISTDQGETWKNYNCSAESYARYGSFPSGNVWYVSAGTWPDYDEQKEGLEEGEKMLTQRLKLRQGHGMELVRRITTLARPNHRNLLQVPGYWAEISKTSDGGKTWKTMFKDVGNFYFNGIDCPDENNCYVVGESESDSLSPGVRILHTGDGGNTWEVQLFVADPTYSLLDISFINATEGWATGGVLTETHFTGDFWHTSDAGKTWTPETVSGVYGTALSFVWVNATQYVGWATAFTRSGQSSVLMYK